MDVFSTYLLKILARLVKYIIAISISKGGYSLPAAWQDNLIIAIKDEPTLFEDSYNDRNECKIQKLMTEVERDMKQALKNRSIVELIQSETIC